MCVYPCPTGPSGVGLTELKRKLLLSDPEHFGVAVPRELTSFTVYTLCIHISYHGIYI